jgi:hypothetical protein
MFGNTAYGEAVFDIDDIEPYRVSAIRSMEVWNKTIIKNTRTVSDIVDTAILTFENPYTYVTDTQIESGAIIYPSPQYDAEIKAYDNNSYANLTRLLFSSIGATKQNVDIQVTFT